MGDARHMLHLHEALVQVAHLQRVDVAEPHLHLLAALHRPRTHTAAGTVRHVGRHPAALLQCTCSGAVHCMCTACAGCSFLLRRQPHAIARVDLPLLCSLQLRRLVPRDLHACGVCGV
eukprot:scaffold10124_cov57-Phaeocystis_antarctica.AAC.4